jgi:cytochrome c556
MSVVRNLLGLTLVVGAIVAANVTVALADDAAVIGYRQRLMQSQGFHAGGIGAILKGESPYKEDLAAHAKGLAADAMLVVNAFKVKTADVKTDSKQEIWSEMAKFEEKSKALATESAKLVEVIAAGGNVGDQMKKVGESCGGCHKDFRKPKEQSYKN